MPKQLEKAKSKKRASSSGAAAGASTSLALATVDDAPAAKRPANPLREAELAMNAPAGDFRANEYYAWVAADEEVARRAEARQLAQAQNESAEEYEWADTSAQFDYDGDGALGATRSSWHCSEWRTRAGSGRGWR